MVSRAADYAVRAVLALAGRPTGARMSLAELAQETEVPAAFLYKVLRTLVQRGLLNARRGKSGGYELDPSARRRSLLDIVDALDGLTVLNVCLSTCGCHRAAECPAHPVWRLAQERMREVLAGVTVSELSHGPAATQDDENVPVVRHGHRIHPGDARERLPRPGGRTCVRLRRDERLPAPPRGREKPGVLAGPRGDGR